MSIFSKILHVSPLDIYLPEQAPLDNLNVEEIFSLWDLSITLKLEHLMTVRLTWLVM